MPTNAALPGNITELPPHDLKRSVSSMILWGILFALLAYSWEGADMRPMAQIDEGANMGEFAAGF